MHQKFAAGSESRWQANPRQLSRDNQAAREGDLRGGCFEGKLQRGGYAGRGRGEGWTDGGIILAPAPETSCWH
jgi:hypothetical protein